MIPFLTIIFLYEAIAWTITKKVWRLITLQAILPLAAAKLQLVVNPHTVSLWSYVGLCFLMSVNIFSLDKDKHGDMSLLISDSLAFVLVIAVIPGLW